MRRRDFIALLGGAAVTWPLVARAQQPAIPVIGFLSGRSPSDSASAVAAFRQGLGEIGYIEGKNVTVEYRWAEGLYDRLPTLAADLVGRQVAVIAATGGEPALEEEAIEARLRAECRLGEMLEERSYKEILCLKSSLTYVPSQRPPRPCSEEQSCSGRQRTN
jgi:hypothetical protein